MTPAKLVANKTHDLNSPTEIHDLVVGFYREIVFDELLEPVFGEVAEVDWALHIPKLIDYWCRVLLGSPAMSGPSSKRIGMSTTSSRSGSNTSSAGIGYGPKALTHVGEDLSPTWPSSMRHGWARRSRCIWLMSPGCRRPGGSYEACIPRIASDDGPINMAPQVTAALSVQHPVALAAMGDADGGALAAEVSIGGGLGLGPGGGDHLYRPSGRCVRGSPIPYRHQQDVDVDLEVQDLGRRFCWALCPHDVADVDPVTDGPGDVFPAGDAGDVSAPRRAEDT